jgi:translation initiation factor 2B subunit (eIF-2B alpha/beta/delta family)
MKPLFISAFFLLFLSCSGGDSPSTASLTEPLDEFLLLVERTSPNEVSMTCEKGCAWVNSSFTIDSTKPKIFDQNGTKSSVDELRPIQTGLPMFTISMTHQGDVIELQGHSGTAWKTLRFSAPAGSVHAINQLGTTEQ